MKYIFIIISASLFLFSCNREKEIDLDLPDYENKLLVECYLEPGQPYRLQLSKTVSYFDPPDLPEVKDAFVTITHNGVTDTLKYDPDTLLDKRFNYSSDKIVPKNYNTDFILLINYQGQSVKGTTKILPPVKIDSTKIIYNADSLGYLRTSFTDHSLTTNYYRYVVNHLTISGGDTTLKELYDLQFIDRITDGRMLNRIREYRLEPENGKQIQLIASLYHIDKNYFDFLQSIRDAVDANGNPFAQPTFLRSNIEGGVGIFTGLSSDRKLIEVK